jgi:hypothetical protein
MSFFCSNFARKIAETKNDRLNGAQFLVVFITSHIRFYGAATCRSLADGDAKVDIKKTSLEY